jgi:hypothetical protein
MKLLLERDYIYCYNKNKENPVVVSVSEQTTQADYFELQDDDALIYSWDEGVAKYRNPNHNSVNIINCERFVKLLPNRIKNAVAVGKHIY